jgi:purine-nucleoside phosphorylase
MVAADPEIAQGVYGGVTGPCYETPAEIRALRAAGADAVGMSTVHEAITAQELGVEVGGLSLITNKAAGLTGEKLNHKEVLETAKKQELRLSRLIENLCRSI